MECVECKTEIKDSNNKKTSLTCEDIYNMECKCYAIIYQGVVSKTSICPKCIKIIMIAKEHNIC